MVALCAAWLLALIWIAVPESDLLGTPWSQTVAAWVQALGSIAAIVWATVIASRQSRERLKSERAALEGLRHSGLHLLEAETALLGSMVNALTAGRAPPMRMLDALERQADNFPTHTVHDRDLSFLLVRGRMNLAAARSNIEGMGAEEPPFPETLAGLRSLTKDAWQELELYNTRMADLARTAT